MSPTFTCPPEPERAPGAEVVTVKRKQKKHLPFAEFVAHSKHDGFRQAKTRSGGGPHKTRKRDNRHDRRKARQDTKRRDEDDS